MMSMVPVGLVEDDAIMKQESREGKKKDDRVATPRF